MELHPPQVNDERFDLYRSYLDTRHDGTMERSREALADFLYAGGVDALEATYRVDGRLIAVSLLDRVPSGWSSVYSFFDPREAKRSPGTLTVLREVEAAARVRECSGTTSGTTWPGPERWTTRPASDPAPAPPAGSHVGGLSGRDGRSLTKESVPDAHGLEDRSSRGRRARRVSGRRPWPRGGQPRP